MTDSMMTWPFSGMGGFCLQVVILETFVLATGLAVVRFFSRSSRPARYLVLQITLGIALLTPLLVTAVQWCNLGWISRPAQFQLVATPKPIGSESSLIRMNERPESLQPGDGIRESEVTGGRGEQASAPAIVQDTLAGVASGTSDPGRSAEASSATNSNVEAVAGQSSVEKRSAILRVVLLAGRLLLGVWLLVAAALLVRMLLGYRDVLRLKGLLQAVENPRTLAILDELVAETAAVRVPRLMASPVVPVPMTIGLVRPAIALPSGLLSDETDSATLKAILLHETAHIARRDLLTALFERLATALYWWHPLIYRLCSRMDELREDICDNWAVRDQGQGETLARCLVDLAAAMCAQHSGQQPFLRPRLTVGALGLDNNGLQRRVARLLRLSSQRTGGNNLLEGKETMIQTTWRTRISVGGAHYCCWGYSRRRESGKCRQGSLRRRKSRRRRRRAKAFQRLPG